MTKIYSGFDVLLIHSYLISCCLIVVVGEQHISPSEELVVQHRFDVVSDGGKQKTLFSLSPNGLSFIVFPVFISFYLYLL